jgi:pimeloyl-ACP methyl ester carboxylesterase
MIAPLAHAGMASAEAPAWILLRGLVRESRHWGDFPLRMKAAYRGADVHCPDVPGNGRRNGETSPASIESMMEDCRATLAAMGAAPPYRLLALSMGGMIAAAWAQRHPGEIVHMVLVNTSMRPFSPFYRRLRPSSYLALARAYAATPEESREAAVLGVVSNVPAHRQAALAAWTVLARERPVRAANALRQLAAAARYSAFLKRPATPTLVLTSARDRLVNSSCSRDLAQAWQAGLAVHTSAGHDLPLDDPDWLITEVKRHCPPTPA